VSELDAKHCTLQLIQPALHAICVVVDVLGGAAVVAQGPDPFGQPGIIGSHSATIPEPPEIFGTPRLCVGVCPCGWRGHASYDRSVRRWRHLDLGGSRLFVEAEVRRLHCRRCRRVRTEAVAWARPAARHSRDLQDLVAFMAQRMDKTTITKLLRISWESVAKIVIDVVADHLDDARLEGLYRIGVDEVSYRKGHRYLTVVADHDRAGAVVWAKEGKDAATLNAFDDELGEARCAQLEAVSMDMGEAFRKATDAKAGAARQCVDPFHVVKVRHEAPCVPSGGARPPPSGCRSSPMKLRAA
jgi:transposase